MGIYGGASVGPRIGTGKAVTLQSRRICVAPMAIASDGTVLVNAHQLTTKNGLTNMLKCTENAGLEVFVGLAVPARLRSRLRKDLDDAVADVVGRLGPRLVRSKPIA